MIPTEVAELNVVMTPCRIAPAVPAPAIVTVLPTSAAVKAACAGDVKVTKPDEIAPSVIVRPPSVVHRPEFGADSAAEATSKKE